jgi:hypothetical protein
MTAGCHAVGVVSLRGSPIWLFAKTNPFSRWISGLDAMPVRSSPALRGIVRGCGRWGEIILKFLLNLAISRSNFSTRKIELISQFPFRSAGGYPFGRLNSAACKTNPFPLPFLAPRGCGNEMVAPHNRCKTSSLSRLNLYHWQDELLFRQKQTHFPVPL